MENRNYEKGEEWRMECGRRCSNSDGSVNNVYSLEYTLEMRERD